jgi:hypothetical protein
VNVLAKGSLSANLAGVIRRARFGLPDARRRLSEAYAQIDPFGHSEEYGTPTSRCLADLTSIPELTLEALIRGQPTIRVAGLSRHIEGTMP